MNRALIDRLRLAAMVADDWTPSDIDAMPPPVHDWANLMDEAAEALEAWEDDSSIETEGTETSQGLE